MKSVTCRPIHPHNELNKVRQQEYLTLPLIDHHRNSLKRRLSFKERYSYYIYQKAYALAITIEKNYTLLLIEISLIDFQTDSVKTKQILRVINPESMDTSVEDDLSYHSETFRISMKQDKTKYLDEKYDNISEYYRSKISLFVKNFHSNQDLKAFLVFSKMQNNSTTVSNFKGKYENNNEMTLGMAVSGYVRIQNNEYAFSAKDSLGSIERSSGTFPRKTSLCKNIAQGFISDQTLAFNICQRSADLPAVRECTLCYNEIANKLRNANIYIPKNAKNQKNYMAVWLIHSPSSSFELTFTPLYNCSPKHPLHLFTKHYKILGKYTGWIILDDGSVIFLHDYYRFAEYMR